MASTLLTSSVGGALVAMKIIKKMNPYAYPATATLFALAICAGIAGFSGMAGGASRLMSALFFFFLAAAAMSLILRPEEER